MRVEPNKSALDLLNELVAACDVGDFQAVKQCLKNGAAPHERLSTDQISPVFRLSRGGHLPILQWLLQQSTWNTAHDNFELAFRSSIINGHLEVSQWLIQNCGSRIELPILCQDAVCWAASNGRLSIVQWLVEETGHLFSDETKNELLLAGILSRNFEVPEWLLTESPLVFDLTQKGCQSVRFLASSKCSAILRWIIEESGQLAAILQVNTDWLLEMHRRELNAVAILGYGVDPSGFTKQRQLQKHLLSRRAGPTGLRVLHSLLDRFNIPKDAGCRAQFCVLEVCRSAAKAGLIQTAEQLKQLVENFRSDTRRQTRKL